MNKKALTETDILVIFITRALVGTNGDKCGRAAATNAHSASRFSYER